MKPESKGNVPGAAAMPCAGSSPTQACRRGRSAPLSTSRELPTNSPSSARWSGCRRRVRAESELAGAETRGAVSVHGDGAGVVAARWQAGISLLSIATYETDYFLVNAGRFDQAVAVLAEAGLQDAFHGRGAALTDRGFCAG